MKKVLLSAVTVLGVFGAFESEAVTIAKAHHGSIPSSVIMDTRALVNFAQTAMRSSAPAIHGVLLKAEQDGIGYTSFDVEEGSFAGLDNDTAVAVSGNTITFAFDMSEVGSSTVAWKVKYAPVLGPNNQIDGWTCTSSLGKAELGSNFIKASDDAIDPTLSGLGWPFAGCVVGTVS
ncbi:MAG: hypothetical protein FJX18_07245 [Alphaproteobacteria bacterium]|nr:hypothetical protein [Alphaproteobacteria bacterium]